MKIKEVLRVFLQRIFTDKETVDYVCGSGEALPLPLSPSEENELLKRLESEREKETAKAELIQHNLRLVVYIARKFDNTGVENDDLVSIGTIGLIKAINSFKTDKKTTASLETDVRGMTLDEAILVVDKFIDDSYISGLHEVTIIHGKGTGVLRAGISDFLRKHPTVKSYRAGRFGEGEMGVTVVTLKDK